MRKDTPCLTLVPGDAQPARPVGLRRRPTRARELVPGTTAFLPGGADEVAETQVRERWALRRASAIDAVREEVDAFRADLLAGCERASGRVFQRSPARRARWLARRIRAAHDAADRLLAHRLAAIDEPADAPRTTQGPGAFWRPIREDQAKGEVVDEQGVVRVTLTVTGDYQWQAVALRTLWDLAAHVGSTARPLRLFEESGTRGEPDARP